MLQHLCDIKLLMVKATLQCAPLTSIDAAFHFTMVSAIWHIAGANLVRSALSYALHIFSLRPVAVFPADGGPGGAVGEPVLESQKIFPISPVRQGIVSSRLVDAITIDNIVVLAAGACAARFPL